MRTTLLRPFLLLALAAAPAALVACSSGSSDPSDTGPPDNSPPPVPTDCATVLEGSWFFDIRSIVGGPILDDATLTQNGCLVFAEQGDWRITGTLNGTDLWDVSITRAGEEVGDFEGTFEDSLESPLFRFMAQDNGNLDGVPIVEVIGLYNPGPLTIDGEDPYDPPAGSTSGGAQVEVHGNGFLDFGLEFVVDGRDAEVLEMIDNNTAVISLPMGDEPGLVDVTVLTADESEGEATDSFTLPESFAYIPCIAVTDGPWMLTLDGVETAGLFEQLECAVLLGIELVEGEPVVTMAGPIDLDGVWTLTYFVDGAPMGSGEATFLGEPATSFSGTLVLDAGGTLEIAGEVPEEEPEEEPEE